MSIWSKIQWFFAKILVHIKQIKRVGIPASEINEMMSSQLPLSFDFKIPVGSGSFSIISTALSIPQNDQTFNIECFCSFQVNTLEKSIYRTHLHIFLTCKPNYSKEKKEIYLNQLEIIDIVLVDDEFSFMKDSRTLLSKFLPSPVKNLLSTTFKTSLGVLNQATNSDVITYLSLYLSGDRQLILDYHRDEIERKIESVIEQGDFAYQLDPDIFEERLFSTFGKRIELVDKQLFFIFHD